MMPQNSNTWKILDLENDGLKCKAGKRKIKSRTLQLCDWSVICQVVHFQSPLKGDCE